MRLKSAGTEVFHLMKQTFKQFSADNCTGMAAGLAYYTVFSLPPLLLIVITIAGAVFAPEQVEGRVEEEITAAIGAEGAEQVRTILDNVHQSRGGTLTTVLGIVGLIFGATGAGSQLQSALNMAWGVQPDPRQGGIRNFLFKRALSLLLVAGIALVLLISLVANSVIRILDSSVAGIMPEGLTRYVIAWANGSLTLLIVVGMFAAVFKILPDVKIAWRDVTVGAAFTAILFLVGKYALELHIGRSNPGNVFGAAGSLAVILVWIYYSSMILLMGAEFTQVWAQRHGKEIVPAKGAIRVIRHQEFPHEPPREAAAEGARLAREIPQREAPELRRGGAS